MKQPIVFTEEQLKDVVGIKIPRTIDEVMYTVYYAATKLEVYTDKGYLVVLDIVGASESENELVLVKEDDSEVKVEIKPAKKQDKNPSEKQDENPSNKYKRVINEIVDGFITYTVTIPVGGTYNDGDFYDESAGKIVDVVSPKTSGIPSESLIPGEHGVVVKFTDSNNYSNITSIDTKLIVVE